MKTQATTDTAYQTTVRILSDAGYSCFAEIPAPKTRGLVYHWRKLQWWSGPKGVVILQVWNDANGCSSFAEWPLGHTFDELRAALTIQS